MESEKFLYICPRYLYQPMVENPILGILVPVYNEEEILPETISMLLEKIKSLASSGLISNKSFLLLVDDGSSDDSWNIIKQERERSENLKALKLSNNVGHQRALLAAYHFSSEKADCVVSLDADLQDNVDVIFDMLKAYRNGAHQVYGIRKNRSRDSFFKEWTALAFYRLMRIMGVEIVYNHADFRLVSKHVLRELLRYRETNIFLRGIFPLMGFESDNVYYDRLERKVGKTKFSFNKMMSFALDGISSFSNVPLRIITWLGVFIFIGSLIISLWILWVVLMDKNVPGWASTILPIYFLGGIQLLAIGILGEYLSKIYLESKQRPHYHIEETIS